MKFLGVIKDDVTLVLDDPQRFASFKTRLKGFQIVLTLEKYYPRRSTKQNNYIHWIFQTIADESGNTLDDVKHYCKQQWASTVDEFGIYKLKHTSDMTTAECSEFTEKILGWAATMWPGMDLTPRAYDNAMETL